MRAAGMDRAKAVGMAGKMDVIGEPKVQPKDLLMQDFDKVSA
jgi:hypothetical protein